MNEFFGSVWWFIVTLGVLVTFHEFGHYWVARRCGVQVLRFSVGFGRPLWSRKAADGTTYQIAMIPLGGYVQFLDERDAPLAPADRERAFNRQPVLKRMAIVAAGPVANLLLCIALLWVTFTIGWPGVAPVIGETTGLAAEAGLRAGDRFLEVDGDATPTWNHAITPIALAAIDREPVSVTIQDRFGSARQLTLALDRLPADFNQADPLAALGLDVARDLPPVVGALTPDSPASGKLQPGDRILSIGGEPIRVFADISGVLQARATAGTALEVRFERSGQTGSALISPRNEAAGSERVWRLGLAASQGLTVLKYGPAAAFRAALAETGTQARQMAGFIGRLVTGKASPKNLSGVIGIAQVARSEANLGLSRLLWFMATLSLTLCIMNLLPIPVLDGGHLLYYLIELVSGRPVGERLLIVGQYAGLALLAGLICLAFYNDLVRTIS